MLTVSRTPYRISFFGGSSDLPSFYTHEPGAVISTAVDKYLYVVLKSRFDNQIRLNYDHNEIVEDIDSLKHELARESLRCFGVTNSVEVNSIGDLPSGTGMGSSSTYTVGLLNTLAEHRGRKATPEELARDACRIEIEKCYKPIGKQDQYIAAYGGLKYITFHQDDGVTVETVNCPTDTLNKLQDGLILFYTGITRKADEILQTIKMEHSQIRELVTLAGEFKKQLESGDLSEFGRLLDISWDIKKSLAKGITTSYIDHCYAKVKKYNASGKICGAGGGGVLMFYAHPDVHNSLRAELSDLTELKIKFEPEGSKIVYSEFQQLGSNGL